jgi:hypothetical protein
MGHHPGPRLRLETKGLEALERDAAAETTPTPVIRRLDLLVLQAPR